MSVGFLFFKTFAFDLLNSKYKNAESVLRAFTFKKGKQKIMLVAQQLGQWAEQTALKLLKNKIMNGSLVIIIHAVERSI